MCEIGNNIVDATFFKVLREAEGCETKVYLDSSNKPTIGIGHLLTPEELHSGYISINGIKIYFRSGITDEQVLALCIQDTDEAVECVNRLVTVKLSQNQFNALVSFCYNIGNTAFRKSTLLRLLNVGRYSDIPTQMRRWIHDDKGNEVQGLINRRESEIKTWLQ